MRIYTVVYDNGEAYEDFWQWLDDKAYVNKEECIKALLDGGYTKDVGGKYVLCIDDYSTYYAEIVELKLTKGLFYSDRG